MRSPPNSFTTAWTREPLSPTQAPPDRWNRPGWTRRSWYGHPPPWRNLLDLHDSLEDLGHLQLEEGRTKRGSARERMSRGPFGSLVHLLEDRPDRDLPAGTAHEGSAPARDDGLRVRARFSMITILPRSIC